MNAVKFIWVWPFNLATDYAEFRDRLGNYLVETVVEYCDDEDDDPYGYNNDYDDRHGDGYG